MKNFRIFLSSPNDCGVERAAVHEVVEALNTDPLFNHYARAEVIAWDYGAGIPFEATRPPQSDVNAKLPKPEDCDVFLCLFRCRFGQALSPTEFRHSDGSPYLSGSEYEFDCAWRARRNGAANPAILVYQWQPPPNFVYPDFEQQQNLEAFFQRSPFKDGQHWMGSYNRFSETEEFARKVANDLRHVIRGYYPGLKKPFASWIKQQSQITTKYAGPRYTRDAHVESDIGKVFDWLLVRQSAIGELDRALAEIYQHMPATSAFKDFKTIFEQVASDMRTDSSCESLPDFGQLQTQLDQLGQFAWNERSQLERIIKKERNPNTTQTLRDQAQDLRRVASVSDSTHLLLKDYAQIAQRRILLLHGPAGQGKTHTLMHEINRILQADGIAVGVLGHNLNGSGSLWDAIRQRLEWDGNTDQFLDALENAAANRHQRALLVFDALNETADRSRWREELPAMIQAVLQRPHLTLAISVREDYLPYVLPEYDNAMQEPWARWLHPGFAGVEPKALAKYFAHFGVKSPTAPPLGEFENPLYVQLLAKSHLVNAFDHWQPSWLEVWYAWMGKLESDAITQLKLSAPTRNQPLRRCMRQLASAMLTNGEFLISRTDADRIALEKTGVNGVIDFLCSAGALMCRPDGNDDDLIEFGFERLSDTFMVDQLLANLFKGKETQATRRQALEDALAPGGNLHPLATRKHVVNPHTVEQLVEHWSKGYDGKDAIRQKAELRRMLAPGGALNSSIKQGEDVNPLLWRKEGLWQALCLALPRYIGTEVPLLSCTKEEEFPEMSVRQAFSDSLRWRSKPEDFGVEASVLCQLWQDNSDDVLEDLIRFAMILGHPLGMATLLHPMLLQKGAPGELDAFWSIYLPNMWLDEASTLYRVVKWAVDADLSEVSQTIALPVAQLLAWTCACSQNGLRNAATEGLTRIVVACPEILAVLLPDFLQVNDAYVLEAVLIAVWGAVLDGRNSKAATDAAVLVYTTQFPSGNARWCHVMLRHYARQVVETALEKHLLSEREVNRAWIRPPYRSSLPLAEVPNATELDQLAESKGISEIVNSCTAKDFYRHVIGSNSNACAFSNTPLPTSNEPKRQFHTAAGLFAEKAKAEIFDLALAGRFVAWNTLVLGWTSERFGQFDISHASSDRLYQDEKTERIGEKYQWIGWHTLLAFLADNYKMQADHDEAERSYLSPQQLKLTMHDPARWMQITEKIDDPKSFADAWHIPTMPKWPRANLTDIQNWIESAAHELAVLDIGTCVPTIPQNWGNGSWIRIFADMRWATDFSPGQWGLGLKFQADIWWQLYPLLIPETGLDGLLAALQDERQRYKFLPGNRTHPKIESGTSLGHWHNLNAEWDEGFSTALFDDSYAPSFPISARHLIAECGNPDDRNEHAPVVVPTPSLFREWQLELDLRRNCILHQGEPLFGLARGIGGKDMLLACKEKLVALLKASGYALVWLVIGEKSAGLSPVDGNESQDAYVDYRGIGYMDGEGQSKLAWLGKEIAR